MSGAATPAPLIVDCKPVAPPPTFLAQLPRPTNPVPGRVSRFQARAIMRRQLRPDGKTLLDAIEADLLAAVKNARKLAPTDPARLAAEDAAEAWASAGVFMRSSPTVQQIAQQYSISPGALDDLFRAAAQVTA
jgi:hypothetical protein